MKSTSEKVRKFRSLVVLLCFSLDVSSHKSEARKVMYVPKSPKEKCGENGKNSFLQRGNGRIPQKKLSVFPITTFPCCSLYHTDGSASYGSLEINALHAHLLLSAPLPAIACGFQEERTSSTNSKKYVLKRQFSVKIVAHMPFHMV